MILGLCLISSTAKAQTDAADPAPWQLSPNQGQQVPPPTESCLGDCNSSPVCDFPSIFDPRGRLSFRGEYLSWWTKSADLPALATTSPSDTVRNQAGVLGAEGTEILFGNGDQGMNIRSGARFTLGYWLTPCRNSGIDVTYMFLSNKAASYDQTSDGSTILARPFYDMETARQNSVIFAFPQQQTGTLSLQDANELNSVEVLFRQAVIRDCDRELDFLVGYRYARFNESLSLNSSSTYISAVGDIPVGTVIQADDLFDAKNEFNGAEIGFTARTRYCRWSIECLTKLAMGTTRSRVNVSGSTVVTESGQSPVSYNGGVLALPTNIGSYEQNDFAVIPEIGVTIGYDITCHLKATVGYTFLYWSNVMRPGDLVDTNVNPTQFPPNSLSGIPSPQYNPVKNDFWAQGLNIGLDYRF
jgi:hypothetical protein